MCFSTGAGLLPPLSLPPLSLEHSGEFTKKTKRRNTVITGSRSEKEWPCAFAEGVIVCWVSVSLELWYLCDCWLYTDLITQKSMEIPCRLWIALYVRRLPCLSDSSVCFWRIKEIYTSVLCTMANYQFRSTLYEACIVWMRMHSQCLITLRNLFRRNEQIYTL